MGLLRDTATCRPWGRLALLLIAGGLLGAAAPVSEYQLKAVFLFNFAQFVEWPPAALPGDSAPFVIGVLGKDPFRSEEHTSELQSQSNLVCRLLLEKKNNKYQQPPLTN